MNAKLIPLIALLWATLGAYAFGRQQSEEIRIDLRVTSAGPGAVVSVDRGASDGLQKGDSVLFRPRTGGTIRGTVRMVDERTSVVELADPAFVPAPGTRGEVLVPRARFETPEPPETQDPPAESPDSTESTGEPKPPIGPPVDPADGPDNPATEHEWENQDEEWTPNLPLLARVKAVRPEDRAKLYSGRLFLITDNTWTTEDGRYDSLIRLGSDLNVENPFGFGGEIDFDVEFNDFEFNVPDLDDDDETAFRVDRLSYAIGGTRFQRDRYEGGRFLQHAMPEFGYLDGAEWTHRRDNGHRFGVSAGYMPELDIDFATGEDFQIAGFYEWIAKGNADLSLAVGAQKTWHDGSPDRDLLVTRAEYIPSDGWDMRGTVWTDFYDSDDDEKDSGPEITQALLSTGRDFDTGSRVQVTYRRLRFPELLRQEFIESVFENLANNRYDRLSVSGWKPLSDDMRFHGSAGLWDDEDESGGDLEAGVDTADLWLEDSRFDVTLYFTRGAFSVDGGLRLAYGRALDNGRWDLFYQVADNHQDDFSHESDDLWEHALRGTRAFYLGNGWNVSVDGETRYWDEELSYSVSLYVQKNF
ncbi:MAG: hypothetical protein AAF682_03075 [Planctomycetota bacterium]